MKIATSLLPAIHLDVIFSLFLVIIMTLMPSALPAQEWERMPIVKQETLAAGYAPGGEGGQVIRALAASAADPTFLMMATDVGGIYRSLDGGKQWQVCMVGWNARGGNAFAIDPVNAQRVLGVGGNSTDWPKINGLYLSTDKAASWKHVLPLPDAHDGALAYDRSSYNARLGYCPVAYFASKTSGIWKTVDGGSTWKQVYNGLSKTLIKVHPTRGYVYVASGNEADAGFWRSNDGGKTFIRMRPEPAFGLDVVASAPDDIYISDAGEILRSSNAGWSFQPIGSGPVISVKQPIKNIQVSPVNRNNMLCYTGGWSNSIRYYSHDGGKSWSLCSFDNKHATLPYNRRDGVWAWHPTEANVVFGVGGDWITKSTDAGKTFGWAGNGENAIMLGGKFNFSPANPNVVAVFFQDYNGAFTLDGGKTWNYRDVSGKGWGGYCYGGYAVDDKVMWGGDAPDWGGTRSLKVSRDGGTTWITARDAAGQVINFAGPDVGYSDPTDSNICFASNWRSADKGVAWAAMPGCDGVFTSNPTGARELYGKKGNDIVKSTDKGVTWTLIATVSDKFHDLAFDHQRQRFYVAAEDKLLQFQNGQWSTLDTPKDQYGNVRVSTVAVDPADPSIVYAGGPANIYASHATVVRSTDAGAHWENLTVNTPLRGAQAGGPHEVSCIRVHPVTRYAWLNGQCFGMWRIAPPQK